MPSRHPCISSVATAIVTIVVGIISTAGATPSVSNHEISDALHELTKAVVDHQSLKALLEIAETLQSHQITINQLLLKGVGTPPQRQPVNYELAVLLGELKAKHTTVSQAVESAIERVDNIEDRLLKLETITSQTQEASRDIGKKLEEHIKEEESRKGEVPPILEDKFQSQSQAMQAVVDQVTASLDQRLQESETIVSQIQEASRDTKKTIEEHIQEEESRRGEVPPILGDKLRNQSQAMQAVVDQVAALDQRLQESETIVSQIQEASRDTQKKIEEHIQEEESHKGEVPPILEDKLQNQSQAMQAVVDQVAALDQRLQESEAIASQIQEASSDIEQTLQNHMEEMNRRVPCRSPFYLVGDDCLFVIDNQTVTWENARKFCKAMEGDLAVPSNVFKLREFLLSDENRSFWVGGSDVLVDNKWRWFNGSEVDLGWEKGQPNNSGGKQHCLELGAYGDWFLNDETCSEKNFFVCQDAKYTL